VTYLEPLETCDTTGEYQTDVRVIVPPSAIVMTHKDEKIIRNGSTIGPLREGHRLEIACEVRGARPQPVVGWYRGGNKLSAAETVDPDESRGLFTVNSKLTLDLTRQELGKNLECRVKTTESGPIVSNLLFIDLEVKPTKIHVSGVKSHVVEGSKVLLQCHVYGARPAANISWYNSSKLIDDSNLLTTISTKAVSQFE
jgi:CD80-like C2-set immunoglobulin domain